MRSRWFIRGYTLSSSRVYLGLYYCRRRQPPLLSLLLLPLRILRRVPYILEPDLYISHGRCGYVVAEYHTERSPVVLNNTGGSRCSFTATRRFTTRGRITITSPSPHPDVLFHCTDGGVSSVAYLGHPLPRTLPTTSSRPRFFHSSLLGEVPFYRRYLVCPQSFPRPAIAVKF